MAIWQYDMRVIPRSGLSRWLSSAVSIPEQIDEESLEKVDWWQGVDSDAVARALSSLLPRHSTWDAKALSWGSYEGHRINLRVSEDRIEELTVRVDVRSLSDDFVPCLLRVLGSLDCLIVSAETRRVLEPFPEQLWDDLRRSYSRRFVDDPEGFLRTLRLEPKRPR
jgi:hypothetical protein